MLVFYSLGLGVPFVVAGLILAALDVLLLTDNLHVLSTWFGDLLAPSDWAGCRRSD